jgi:hypothetical protein
MIPLAVSISTVPMLSLRSCQSKYNALLSMVVFVAPVFQNHFQFILVVNFNIYKYEAAFRPSFKFIGHFLIRLKMPVIFLVGLKVPV